MEQTFLENFKYNKFLKIIPTEFNAGMLLCLSDNVEKALSEI